MQKMLILIYVFSLTSCTALKTNRKLQCMLIYSLQGAGAAAHAGNYGHLYKSGTPTPADKATNQYNQCLKGR